jgi:hypothetical protein
MHARKPPRRLFKSRDVVHVYQHDRENRVGMKHITRDHLDVLQNIESALMACHKQVPDIDDYAVDRALENAIRAGEPDRADPAVEVLGCALEAIRNSRDDVPDHIWRGGLKTVSDSVRRHSTLAPGETSYLEFVAQYIR